MTGSASAYRRTWGLSNAFRRALPCMKMTVRPYSVRPGRYMVLGQLRLHGEPSGHHGIRRVMAETAYRGSQLWQEHQGLRRLLNEEDRLSQRWADRRQSFELVNETGYCYGENGKKR